MRYIPQLFALLLFLFVGLLKHHLLKMLRLLQ
ncbi:hypothetical protein [Lacinutrix himadriensis]